MLELFKKIYIFSSGYSFTHLGRFFLRMFVGVMLMQFAVRAWMDFDATVALTTPALGLSASAAVVCFIFIGIFCSLCVMTGFCTRLMALPPLFVMIVAECLSLATSPLPPNELSWTAPAFLPMMFIGIYFFILLVGPGKISFDYFLALHLIHKDDLSEDELEEV